MKIFISGATGFIGSRLAIRLANEGNIIHALYRSEARTDVIRHPNILLFKGDILNLESLNSAIAGCEQIYHIAAFTKTWDPIPSHIYHLNIEGTVNVVIAGINAGVKKFLCTSTAGVLGPSEKNKFVDEYSYKPEKFFNDYESSKAILEKILITYCKSGIPIVIVNPTRVYGPGLLTESNGVTRMIKSFIEGRWRIIPGTGKSIGNYVHVDDVVSGHILAMNKGVPGENYILGGSNISYNDFFEKLSFLSKKKYFMIHIPLWFMLLLSHGMIAITKITGKNPLVTPLLVKKFVHEWNVSSTKAINELGYNPMSLDKGLQNTLEWLSSH